jgi:hypothetical protein
MAVQGESASIARVPTRVPDSFLIAMDAFMRRTGQGAHISQSLLELDRVPDLAKLRVAARRVVQKHPLLTGRLRRSWRTWLAYWEVPPPPDRPLPIGFWREPGSPGALGPEAVTVEDGMTTLQERMHEPCVEDAITFNARLDVLELRDGRSVVALTWSHLLMDGKGAELLLADLGRLAEGEDLSCETPDPVRAPVSFGQKFQRAKAAVMRLAKLDRVGVRSLNGPRPRPGRCRYELIPLTPAESAIVRARAEQMTGSLFPLPYYLACATRAHQAVFEKRGKVPEGYIASVPIQMRKRGGRGPIFHNHMTILFFCAMREELGTLDAAATALKKQFGEMTRERLDESFATLLELMMRMPSRVFMTIVRMQFGGEISSFFHSHTGQFAPELTSFAGAEIENANHLPSLGSPPGTGIFLCERGERVNLALSWRDGAITDDERRVMVDRLFEDLLGGPRQNPGHGD